MAASSKPTAVHFTLVFFVLVSAILGVLFFVTQRSLDEKLADLKKKTDELGNANTGLTRASEQINALKKLVGLEFEDVGETDPKATSVIGAANAVMPTDAPQRALVPVLIKTAEERTTAFSDRDSAKTEAQASQANLAAANSVNEEKLKAEADARSKSEKDLADLAKVKDDEIKKKESDINELKTAIANVQTELDQANDSRLKIEKELNGRIAALTSTNTSLARRLEETLLTSFEVPDGIIRSVNHDARLVWINLGHSDNLHTRTQFSVYTKANSGVARGLNDIKGAIEVTRILEPHLAECKILRDDIYNPIGTGDPVYTPLWSPGGTEQFAIVGKIDIDGDGISDRDRFHELITSVGSAISNEVDDQGVLLVNGQQADKPIIDETTKFLIVGRIPDFSDAVVPEEKDMIKKMYDHKRSMEDAAREHAVRVVKLTDFLAWVGYVPERRLYVPGGEGKFNLKEGSRGASVNESINTSRPTSSGQTSGAYSGDSKIKARSSGNANSKIFRGNGK